MNSTYEGFVAFDETATVYDGGPVGIDEVRTLQNNTQWACDYAGRTLIKWVINDSTHERVPDGTGGGSATTEWYRLAYWRIDVLLRDDGAYRFRCRIGGRSTQAASGDGYFRLAIDNPRIVELSLMTGTSLSNVMEVSSASGTHAWLNTGTLLTVPQTSVDASMVEQRTVTAVGGAYTSVPVCRLAVLVMGRETHTSTRPGLSGVVVEEYYGS